MLSSYSLALRSRDTRATSAEHKLRQFMRNTLSRQETGSLSVFAALWL